MAQTKHGMDWWTPLGNGNVSIKRIRGELLVRFGTDGFSSMVWLRDLAEAVCFVRDLEHALDTLQPGLFFPLPEGDANEADAMIVHDRADQIERSVK